MPARALWPPPTTPSPLLTARSPSPATLTVLVNSVTKTYGDEITDYFGVIWSGLRNNDNITIASLASDGGTATASVGVYGFTATFNDPDGKLSNFNVVYDGTLTVEKATLTVTADDQTKTYGDSAADFTGSLGELKNNDNITVTGFSSAGAAAGAAVGDYDIIGTLNDPDGKLGNYDIVYAGTLTVDKATLTVTADDASRDLRRRQPDVHGDDQRLQERRRPVNFRRKWRCRSEHRRRSIERGRHLCDHGGPRGLGRRELRFRLADGTLTVNKATLTVTADDASRTYGTSTRRSPPRSAASRTTRI